MALSTNIYAEVTTTFPASVVGSGAITVTKSGGVYTIGYDGTGVPVNSVGNDKLAKVAASRLIGNPTGAEADRSEISLGGDLEFSGTSLRGAALSGDVTKAAGGTTTAITAGAVGTTELADGSATGTKIGADAVDGTKIADNSIDSEHYVDGSIDRVHLVADIIDGTKLADDSVDSEHYVAASIDHEHLADDVITGATDRTAFASGDKLLIHETGVGLRKIDYDDLPSGGGSTADGAVIASQYGEYTTNASLSTTIPFDDTIPQSTEGTQILAVAITPSATTSKIRIRFNGTASHATSGTSVAVAVFKDSDASAIASDFKIIPGNGFLVALGVEYVDSPATTSAVTYKIRVGAGSGNMSMNGQVGSRYGGGTMVSSITLEEIKGS